MVLKPSESINPWMNLSEWVLRNANLTYDSYDLNTFTVFWNGYSNNIDSAPLIFIDGVKYNASTIESNNLILPNISPNSIDSVIIDFDSKIINGYFTENGSVRIYLKKISSSLLLEKGLANEINDPGPHISTELRSRNVEAIDYSEKITLWFPKKWNSSLILTRNRYSRSNFFIYDDKPNTRLFSRTLDNNESGSPRLQRNILINALLSNNVSTDLLEIQLLNTFTRKGNYYLWSPVAGIELPFSMDRFQSGINILPKKNSFFKGFSASLSYSNYDSLFDAGSKAFEMEEFFFDQSLAFSLSELVTLNVETNFKYWKDQITLKTEKINTWKSSLMVQKNIVIYFSWVIMSRA